MCVHNYFQIPESTVRKLLTTVPPSESSMFRVDFRSGHVHYLNNLEEDAMYKRWRSNINEVIVLLVNIKNDLDGLVFPCFLMKYALHNSFIELRF